MPHFSASERQAVESLAKDLEEVFGPRLRSLVAYGGHGGDGVVHSCAIVDTLSFQDLAKSLPYADRWRLRRLGVPLMLSEDELGRTIDIFPLEYAAIAADHVLVRGGDPFAGLAIAPEDLRRAVEAQAKSHLIHLREAYLESRGDPMRIAEVIAGSAGPLRTLLVHIARLAGGGRDAATTDEALAALAETGMGTPPGVIRDVLGASASGASAVTDPSHLLSRYIAAAEQVWDFVDRWS